MNGNCCVFIKIISKNESFHAVKFFLKNRFDWAIRSFLSEGGNENSKNLAEGEGVDLKITAGETKRGWRK